MSPYQEYAKLLLAHTSNDETRFHLTGIYYDGDRFVATDGHRLITLNAQLSIIPKTELKPDTIYDRTAFKLEMLKRMDGKYPNYKQLIPAQSKLKYKFKMTIPDWFIGVKKRRNQPMPAIGIDENGQWTTGKGYITWLNISYLAPYAGMEVSIEIGDELSPIVIKPWGAEDNWTAVVMPMRGGAYPVMVIKTASAEMSNTAVNA